MGVEGLWRKIFAARRPTDWEEALTTLGASSDTPYIQGNRCGNVSQAGPGRAVQGGELGEWRREQQPETFWVWPGRPV